MNREKRARLQKARLDRLKEFYSIAGDGVARLRLSDAVASQEFRNAVRKISDLELEDSSAKGKEENHNESYAQ